MRIGLTGEDVIITDQLQTYVEYRFFISVARYQALIRGVNVLLGHNPGNGGRFLCVVAVDLGLGERIKIRASGAYPNAAIDRAADRTSFRLSRHTFQHVSS
jgi:ribosome-associated translation inhibitor RaiA